MATFPNAYLEQYFSLYSLFDSTQVLPQNLQHIYDQFGFLFSPENSYMG